MSHCVNTQTLRNGCYVDLGTVILRNAGRNSEGRDPRPLPDPDKNLSLDCWK